MTKSDGNELAMRPGGSCPRTAHSGARRSALITADASAPERAPVRGHPCAAPCEVPVTVSRKDWSSGAGREPCERRVSCVSREPESEGRDPRQLTELPHATDSTRDEGSRAVERFATRAR